MAGCPAEYGFDTIAGQWMIPLLDRGEGLKTKEGLHTFQVRREGAAILLCAAFTFLAGAIRVAAAQGDLWLDEIWTLYLLLKVRHVGEIFTIHHDNNHFLTSLSLHFLGNHSSPLVIRLLSVATSTATVSVMGFLGFRHGLRAGLLALVLGTFSYPLVHYGSEARGYAPAALFALLAHAALPRAGEAVSPGKALSFWVCCLMGLLSHLTFIHVLASFMVGTLCQSIHLQKGPMESLFDFLKVHLIPILGVAVVYVFHIRKLTYGGGDPQGITALLLDLFTLASGAPGGGAAQMVGILAVLAGLLGGFAYLYVKSPMELPFHIAMLVAAPTFFWLLSQAQFVYPRYFLLCFPFYFLLLARALADFWERGVAPKLVVAGFITLYLWGSAQRNLDLLRLGRGSYGQAVLFMAAETSGPDILVGSDHDFRNKMVLLYYTRQLPRGKRLVYFDRSDWPCGGPEWLILHSQQSDFVPAVRISTGNGTDYELARHFPFTGLSGWHWAVYRKR